MPSPKRPPRPAAEPSPAAPHAGAALATVAGLLFVARYLQATEGAVFGSTLWVSQLWLAVAATWCWTAARRGTMRLRVGILDLFLWLLVLGHVVSTIPVLIGGGDRRGAVNLCWEWAGVAASVFVLRQIFPAGSLRRPLAAFAAVMVAMSCLGLYQHYVEFPARAAQYDALRAAEDRLAATADFGRLQEVRQQLAELGRPDDPNGRVRFEDRMRYSSEPLGVFALQNTLGGLLAAAVPLLVAAGCGRDRRGRAATFLAAGLVAYCLILTKSRTAWVGLAAGAAVAGGTIALRGRVPRRLLWAAAGIVGLAFAGTAVAAAAGGLDRQVLSEAPKSLRYRLEYWTATLDLLRERPLLGTGPANFRSYYLEHRLPGASEAIAAPHNLFLDAWTAGGLLGLAAAVGLIGTMAVRVVRPPNRPTPSADDSGWTRFETGAVAAFPVVFLIGWLSGDGLDFRLLAIAPVAVGMLVLLKRSNGPSRWFVGSGAAAVALGVHLLGADGFEFPAVSQTLFVLAAILLPAAERTAAGALRFAPAFGFGLLTLACLLTGTAPVLNGNALIARAEDAVRRGDPAADRLLAEAAEADPLALSPLILRAELATERAGGDGAAVAERRWDAVLRAEPRDIHARRRLAELLHATGDDADRHKAAELLAEAVRLSPTDARLRLEAAAASAADGRDQAATGQARQAIRLDNLNRDRGHRDQYLSESDRSAAERLAGDETQPAAS